jgi:hypothetical protein
LNQDTIAILDVVSPAHPLELLDRLSEEPALAALVGRFGADWTVTEWTLQPSASDPRVVDILGPGGILLRLGKRCVEVYHLIPFSAFAEVGDAHLLVRRAFRAVARLVGSKRAIYTHELAATDRDPDAGTEEVIANLTSAAGAPSTTFADLARAEPYREGSWYVDTFDDLDAN